MQVPLLVDDFLQRAARLYPTKTAIVDGDLRFTYARYQERVNQLSHALLERGVGKGDRVCILSPNSHFFLESFYATSQIGAILVPLNYRLVSSDHQFIIDHAGVKAVLVDSEYVGLVDAIRDELPTVQHWIVAAYEKGDYGLGRLERDDRSDADERTSSARPRRERSGLDQLYVRDHSAAQGCHAHPPQRLHQRV